MSLKALCFVAMPFGKKHTVSGLQIDFDEIYRDFIGPAIEAADLKPLRADEEMTGGIIHKPMFERLILCEYAVVDLTTANANVFYELGVRHAVRPHSTVLVFAEGSGQLPFDLAQLRAIPYKLSTDGTLTNLEKYRTILTNRLIDARQAIPDSPLFQLLEDYPDIDHTKTDVFRDLVHYSEKIKNKLARAREQGLEHIKAVEIELGKIEDCEAGVAIDLFLSYRAVKGWQEMIALFDKMSPPLSSTVLVQEQLAFALNRVGRGDDAERVLLNLIAKRGPSSETYGLLGRVYKDRWETAQKAGDVYLARGLLDKAIDAYLKGFEADWRDAYPGVNAVTLMELKDPPYPRKEELIPVVAYAVNRRIAIGKPDYWDYATLLELAVLSKEKVKAFDFLCKAFALIRETWEPETTARNLRLIRETRERRGERLGWDREIEKELEQKAKEKI